MDLNTTFFQTFMSIPSMPPLAWHHEKPLNKVGLTGPNHQSQFDLVDSCRFLKGVDWTPFGNAYYITKECGGVPAPAGI